MSGSRGVLRSGSGPPLTSLSRASIAAISSAESGNLRTPKFRRCALAWSTWGWRYGPLASAHLVGEFAVPAGELQQRRVIEGPPFRVPVGCEPPDRDDVCVAMVGRRGLAVTPSAGNGGPSRHPSREPEH
jgi:hypothetical protein